MPVYATLFNVSNHRVSLNLHDINAAGAKLERVHYRRYVFSVVAKDDVFSDRIIRSLRHIRLVDTGEELLDQVILPNEARPPPSVTFIDADVFGGLQEDEQLSQYVSSKRGLLVQYRQSFLPSSPTGPGDGGGFILLSTANMIKEYGDNCSLTPIFTVQMVKRLCWLYRSNQGSIINRRLISARFAYPGREFISEYGTLRPNGVTAELNKTFGGERVGNILFKADLEGVLPYVNDHFGPSVQQILTKLRAVVPRGYYPSYDSLEGLKAEQFLAGFRCSAGRQYAAFYEDLRLNSGGASAFLSYNLPSPCFETIEEGGHSMETRSSKRARLN